ncbi:hypothetical protein [Streptomyces sp. NPDC005408]|uniref:hypothetical protein n=1 Tax=Streptomyces sp. NPDC005408 TaxID=3155341 RepID=UPI0033BBC47B
MRTKRLAIAGAAALVLAGGAGTAIAVDRASAPGRTGAATTGPHRPAAAVNSPSSAGPRVVQPYQPVEIGRGAKMGLLPEGRQNFVVGYEDFERAVEQAKGYPGSSIRPNSISGGIGSDGDNIQFTGAYRTDTVPARMTLRLGKGAETEVSMLRLPGKPGWGTYYLDLPGSGPWREPVKVTAYDGNGKVLASLAFAPKS